MLASSGSARRSRGRLGQKRGGLRCGGSQDTQRADLAPENWSSKKGAVGRPHATHSPLDSTTRSLCFQTTVPISPAPPLEPSWATASSLPSRHCLQRISRACEGESGSRHPVNPNPSHAPTGNRCPLPPATPPASDQAHHFNELTHAGLRRASEGAALRPPWHSICEEIDAVRMERLLDRFRGPTDRVSERTGGFTPRLRRGRRK